MKVGEVFDIILVLCFSAPMKTTLDLPDDLMREVKVLAAQSDRKLKDLLAELIRNGMVRNKKTATTPVLNRVSLPLVDCGKPGEIDLSPEQIDQVLLSQETNSQNEPV